METSPPSQHQLSLPLSFGVQDGPAKTSATQTQDERDSRGHGVPSSTPLWTLFRKSIPRGLSWKMSRASYRRSEEPLLRQLSTRLKRTGIWGDGFRATFSIRAFPTTGIVYSLWQLIDQTVVTTSLLTAANCQGILRREKRAGRRLDPHFLRALEETLRLWSNVAAASGTPPRKAFAPRYVPKLEDIKAGMGTDQYYVARNLTWTECEPLMGFPQGWTVVEGDSLATQSAQPSSSGSAGK